MRIIFIAAILLTSIVGKAQTVPKREGTWITINSLLDRLDSLEARIKVLEARPTISILPLPGHPDRGVWITGPGYSLMIKSFDYGMPPRGWIDTTDGRAEARPGDLAKPKP